MIVVVLLVFTLVLMLYISTPDQQAGSNIIPPENPPIYLDNVCKFSVKRGKPIKRKVRRIQRVERRDGTMEDELVEGPEEIDSCMVQPIVRPCGLNQISLQNCAGNFLVGKPEANLRYIPLIWTGLSEIETSLDKTWCFMFVPPLNPNYKTGPGYYVSIKSTKWTDYYFKIRRNGKLVLDKPYTGCNTCGPPKLNFVFKINRAFAKFDQTYSIKSIYDNFIVSTNEGLALSKEDPKNDTDRQNVTFHFGPNPNIF